MTARRAPNFATIALHAGAERDQATGARVESLAQAGSKAFDGIDQAASPCRHGFGAIHMRAEDPMVAALEERIAALEDGVAAVAAASGRAAQLLVFNMLMKPGDDVIAAHTLRDGATGRLDLAFNKFGWEVKWADPDDLSTFAAAIGPRTKAIFIESMANPSGAIVDIEAIAAIARAVSVPLIVDNTLATPYLIRPFVHGADIVIHSTATILGGHANSIGELLIDGGAFNWLDDPRYPMLSAPRPEYGGTIMAKAFGNFSFAVGARVLGLRDLGCPLSPSNAAAILTGIETLALRLQRQCENALAVAEHLSRHPAVLWVNYPALASDPSHTLAQKYCPDGAGAALAFGLKGGYDAAAALIARLTLFSRLSKLGDSRSRAVHPASSANFQTGEADQMAANRSPEAVRLSIGIEDKKDIIADLDQALAA